MTVNLPESIGSMRADVELDFYAVCQAVASVGDPDQAHLNRLRRVYIRAVTWGVPAEHLKGIAARNLPERYHGLVE